VPLFILFAHNDKLTGATYAAGNIMPKIVAKKQEKLSLKHKNADLTLIINHQ